jgi:hypothetical protein
MSSTVATLVVLTFLVVGIVATVSSRAWRAWRRYREPHVVTCPETQRPATIIVNAVRAARASAIASAPILELTRCSRWSEGRARCSVPCLTQLPVARTTTAIVHEFFAGRPCVRCGRPIDAARMKKAPPAFAGRNGVSFAWTDAPCDALPYLLETHQPVCASCHAMGRAS